MALMGDIIKKYEAEAARRIREAQSRKTGGVQGLVDGAVINEGTTRSLPGLKNRGATQSVFDTTSNEALLQPIQQQVAMPKEAGEFTGLDKAAGATDFAQEVASLRAEIAELRGRLARLETIQ